jgi:hypothetical protein
VPIDPETAEPVDVETPNEVRGRPARGMLPPLTCASPSTDCYYTSPAAVLHACPAVVLQYECEDALGDAHLFDALGVGLGRAEIINVALAVKKLGEDPQKAVDTVGLPAAEVQSSTALGCTPCEAVQLRCGATLQAAAK